MPAVIHWGFFIYILSLSKDAKLLRCSEFLHFCYKLFCGLECRYIMSRYHYTGLGQDVTSELLSALFHNKAAKSAQVNIFTILHRILHRSHESFNNRKQDRQ